MEIIVAGIVALALLLMDGARTARLAERLLDLRGRIKGL